MKMSKEKWQRTLTLAAGIALLPPVWAVLSPYLGITTGAVALICAGLFVASGNEHKKALPISIGFLLGDGWAVLALAMMDWMEWNADLELYLTLFLLGAVAVIAGSLQERLVYLPAWLCGWAIGLTILAPVGIHAIGSLPLQIGAAMLVGVWYVGVGVDLFQKWILHRIQKR